MKKKIVLSIAALSIAGFVTGCGGGGGGSSSNNTASNTAKTPEKSVKVVDGYVIGANVCDANNICATTDNNGIAKAKFADTILTSKGGYIDVNANKKIDDNDIALPNDFTLKTLAGKNVITPITDLIANGANPTKLAEILGVDETKLYDDPIATNNIDLAKAIQIVYALKAENKEDALIQKINNFTPKSTPNTDLPTFNETKQTKTTTQKETNTTPATTDLPPMKVVTTDLPTFDETPSATKSNSDKNNTNENTTTASNTISGNLETFANLALSVADDEAKTLITAIINSTATNPAALEESIADLKKELIKAPENNEAKANQTTEQKETKQAQEVAENTETNQAVEQKETNQTVEQKETNQSTEEATETTQTNSSTAHTDLPPF